MALLFRLHEHNFQNVVGDRMTDMDQLSEEGWDVVSCTIAFPYVHVLWSKDAGASEARAPVSHDLCKEKQDQLQAEKEQLRNQANAALNARTQERDQAVKERDEAREIARQFKAEADRLSAAPQNPE